MSTIYRCKNQVVSFNKRSAELKAAAIADGMDVHTEWQEGEFDCFMARHSQSTIKAGKALYAECGANVNCNPTLWSTTPGKGSVDSSVYLQK